MAKEKKKKNAAQEQDIPEIEVPPAQEAEETAAPEADSPAEQPAPPQEAPVKDPGQLLAEAADKYLRLAAEYDNYRKRTVKEKESAWSEARAQTVAAFLPVYDNLERRFSSSFP